MTDMFPDPGDEWLPRLRRFLLDVDARIDFTIFLAGKWARELYERFTAAMDGWHVAGWRRWILVEPLSEMATLGTGGLLPDAGARHSGLSSDLRRRLAQESRPRRHLSRPLRQRGRQPRHQAQRIGAARPVPGPSDQGGARHRGPALLRAFRHRLPGHVPRADDQRPGRRRGARRLDAYAAARQEPVPVERAHHRAQDQRSVPGGMARDPSHQERDPQALSRPRLSGRRRLRRRCRGRILFRQVGARRDLGGSGDARRHVQGADQVLAAGQSAGGACARQCRARQSGRQRLHDRRSGLRRAAQSGDPDRPHRRRRAELLSRFRLRRDAQARRHVPEIGHRPLFRGAHRARFQSAALCRTRDRKRSCANTAATTAPANRQPCSPISTAASAP